jgi:CheY-like chemotaxis protein
VVAEAARQRYITIPLIGPSITPVARTIAAPRHVELPVVLLVDRDGDTRQMYGEFLKQCAWDVIEAGDGAEALIKALARRPSIIITETRLPIVDGFELCERLRREAATEAIPILVLTADAYTPDVERARAAGADLVLIKPCLPDSLRDQMQQLVNNARQRAASGGMTVTAGGARRRTAHAVAKAPAAESTTTPPVTPPSLDCPSCRRPLVYQRSHLGKALAGRSREQWDYYVCPGACGHFQYRHRTGGLRLI